MVLKIFFAVMLVSLSAVSARGDFEFTFDRTSDSVSVGNSISFDLFVSETAGTSFFSQGLTGASLSLTNSNAAAAKFTGFTRNGLFTVGAPNVTDSSVTFVLNSFPNEITGTSRLIGSVTLEGVGGGGITTDIQAGLHPTTSIDELTFGFTTNVELSGPTPDAGATFQAATITAVPEPSSIAVLGLTCVGLVMRRRRA